MNIRVVSGISSRYLSGNDLVDPITRESYSEMESNGRRYWVESTRYILMKVNRGTSLASRHHRMLNKLKNGTEEK